MRAKKPIIWTWSRKRQNIDQNYCSLRVFYELYFFRCKCMILIADVEVGNVKPFRLSRLLPTQRQTNHTPRSETTVPCSKPGSSSVNKPDIVQNGFPSSTAFPTPPSRYEQSPNSGPITTRSSPGAEPTRSPPVQQSTGFLFYLN